MTPREQAIKAINEGGSVVVDNKMYTKANLADLPPMEAFVEGDADAQAKVLAELKAQKDDLEARVKEMAAKLEDKKPEPKKEDKKSAKDEIEG